VGTSDDIENLKFNVQKFLAVVAINEITVLPFLVVVTINEITVLPCWTESGEVQELNLIIACFLFQAYFGKALFGV